MKDNVSNFINNFQDMFVTKTTTISNFPNNLSSIDLVLIEKQLDNLKVEILELSEITNKAAIENYSKYLELIAVLEDKIEYVSDMTNMLLYINSFYDMSNVVDIKNYDLKSSAQNSSLVYDANQKGLTLRGVSSVFQCAKDVSSENTITFYNTNSSYHSGISLESPFLDLLDIKSIIVRRADGTVLNLSIDSLNKGTNYLRHDFLTSTQIIVEFYADLYSLPPEQKEYYDSLNISLIDYRYLSEGNVVLDVAEFKSGDMLNLIYNYELPDNCFINLDLSLDLLDLNGNKLQNLNFTLPLGNPKICKRLDWIDFNTVENISGIYINNKYKSKGISQEYLEGITNKNEVYVVYIPKISEIIKTNKFIKILNNQGFTINNKSVDSLNMYCNLTMYSFNESSTPLLKIFTGITKHE